MIVLPYAVVGISWLQHIYIYIYKGSTPASHMAGGEFATVVIGHQTLRHHHPNNVMFNVSFRTVPWTRSLFIPE